MILAGLALVLASCTGDVESNAGSVAGQDTTGTSVYQTVPTTIRQEQEHEVTGILKTITPSGSHLVVEHETIPGFMDAMTMPFAVSDTASLPDLKAGDRIQFSLSILPRGAVIHTIHKVETSTDS